MYNKNIFRKANDKKLLHKIGKQWVTVSIALLALIGGGAIASHTTHADTNAPTKAVFIQNNHQQISNGNNQTNSSANTISHQATNLHANLVNNAVDASNATKIPSSAPINQKGSYNSAYMSYEAQMSGTDAKVAGMNAENVQNNSNKSNDKLILKDNNTDYFSGSIIKTGTDDGLNYKVYANGGVEFTNGIAHEEDDYDSVSEDISYSLLNAKAVKFDHSLNISDMSNMFCSDKNLREIDLQNLDTSHVTKMTSMFQSDYELQSLNLPNSFNTSNVTNMSDMFKADLSLKSLNLGSNFNTNQVTNMKHMFMACTSLKSLDLSHFNTNQVTNMRYMFAGDISLESLEFGNKFNANQVHDMDWMFAGDTNLQSLDLSPFNTNNVQEMGYMFAGDISLQHLNLGDNFSTKNIVIPYDDLDNGGMTRMFAGDISLHSLVLPSKFVTPDPHPQNGIIYDSDSPDNYHYLNPDGDAQEVSGGYEDTSDVEKYSRMYELFYTVPQSNINKVKFDLQSIRQLIANGDKQGDLDNLASDVITDLGISLVCDSGDEIPNQNLQELTIKSSDFIPNSKVGLPPTMYSYNNDHYTQVNLMSDQSHIGTFYRCPGYSNKLNYQNNGKNIKSINTKKGIYGSAVDPDDYLPDGYSYVGNKPSINLDGGIYNIPITISYYQSEINSLNNSLSNDQAYINWLKSSETSLVSASTSASEADKWVQSNSTSASSADSWVNKNGSTVSNNASNGSTQANSNSGWIHSNSASLSNASKEAYSASTSANTNATSIINNTNSISTDSTNATNDANIAQGNAENYADNGINHNTNIINNNINSLSGSANSDYNNAVNNENNAAFNLANNISSLSDTTNNDINTLNNSADNDYDNTVNGINNATTNLANNEVSLSNSANAGIKANAKAITNLSASTSKALTNASSAINANKTAIDNLSRSTSNGLNKAKKEISDNKNQISSNAINANKAISNINQMLSESAKVNNQKLANDIKTINNALTTKEDKTDFSKTTDKLHTLINTKADNAKIMNDEKQLQNAINAKPNNTGSNTVETTEMNDDEINANKNALQSEINTKANKAEVEAQLQKLQNDLAKHPTSNNNFISKSFYVVVKKSILIHKTAKTIGSNKDVIDTIKPNKYIEIHVLGIKDGHYVINYMGHHYFITANHKYVDNAYYQKHNLKKTNYIKIIKPAGEYRNINFNRNSRVITWNIGTVMPIHGVKAVGKNDVTRFKLVTGHYITANKLFVKLI